MPTGPSFSSLVIVPTTLINESVSTFISLILRTLSPFLTKPHLFAAPPS